MKWYFVKTPRFIEKLFNKQTWRFSSKKKEIYLTFDDGPTPEITQWVLKTLALYHAKATFFCIGKNIKNHPDIFHKILDGGHAIGNHTYAHCNGWKTSTINYVKSVLKTEKEIEKFKHKNLNTQKLFRPPYGKIKPSQTKMLRKNNYQIIMWTVLSADFDSSITSNTCLEYVINNVENGSIIVFHDSVKAFKKLQDTLPKILAYFSEKGYSFKHIAPQD